MHRMLVSTAAVLVIATALPLAAAVAAGDPITVASSAAAPVAQPAAPTVAPAPVVESPVAGEHPSVSLRPVVMVRNADAEQHELVDEALARFRGAGLGLPDVEIVFYDDPEQCSGHDGRFQQQYTPWRLLVCSVAGYVVTHELAHAWEAANLDDVARAGYVRSRGLKGWDSPELTWRERGVEDVAFMLQQNLMAGRVDVTSDRWIERTDAYTLLTGRRSPVLPPLVDAPH